MPYIRTTVSKSINPGQRDILKSKLGNAIALIPGKSEAWLMLAFEDNMSMYFKGDNSAAVKALISEAQAAGIYSGVRADISGGDTVTAFLEEVNADFVILSGADETLGDYVSKVTAVCEKITAIDSAAEIGVEPVYCSNISAGLDELISGGSIDFVFVVQSGNDDSAFSIFENAQTIWNEKAISVWMCHCLKGLG